MERVMGFEPTTSSLGSWRSTPELHPHGYKMTNLGVPVNAIRERGQA